MDMKSDARIALEIFGDILDLNGLFLDLPLAQKLDREIAILLEYTTDNHHMYDGLYENEIINLNNFLYFAKSIIDNRDKLPLTNHAYKKIMAKKKVKDLERDFE